MTALVVTAEAINAEYRAARSSYVDSANHILTLGRMLAEKKAELGHGNFIPWVEANCEFGPRQARHFMAAAKRKLTSDLTEADAGLSGTKCLVTPTRPPTRDSRISIEAPTRDSRISIEVPY